MDRSNGLLVLSSPGVSLRLTSDAPASIMSRKQKFPGKIFSMTKYNFIQLDVFTNQAFAGNPLAVFPEAEGLNDEQMMKIAREMNLSETVFVLKPEQTVDGKQSTGNSKQRSAASEEQTTQAGNPQSELSKQQSPLRRLRIFTPARRP